MKIKTKLLSSFLVIGLMLAFVGSISLFQLNKIAGPLNEEIPMSIEEISKHSELDAMARFIEYYDEVLTMSARNYAFTQNKKWETRYNNFVPKLDAAIGIAIEKGDEADKVFFTSVDGANIALIDMETEAINLVNQGLSEQAVTILESDAYWEQKSIYLQGLVHYVERRGVEYDEALQASTIHLEVLSDDIVDLIKISRNIIILSLIIALILSFIVAHYISSGISNPLLKLTKMAEDISNGQFDASIDSDMLSKKGEVGDLARALDRTVASLKLAMMDQKNQEEAQD